MFSVINDLQESTDYSKILQLYEEQIIHFFPELKSTAPLSSVNTNINHITKKHLSSTQIKFASKNFQQLITYSFYNIIHQMKCEKEADLKIKNIFENKEVQAVCNVITELMQGNSRELFDKTARKVESIFAFSCCGNGV